VDTTKELPTVISFCSGYGGIERGLDLAGIKHRVLAYVEIEAYVIANLVAKMETGQLPPCPIYTDIKTFPSDIFRGKVDIITGGYPCQPFSLSGSRKGENDERHLWKYIRKHVQTIRPSRFFFENVEGHVSLGLSTVLSDMEEDGYGTTWGIFSANEVGAPHRRKRVFIMGDTNSPYSKGGRVSCRMDQEYSNTNSTSNSIREQTTQQWEAEPRVGRVVDGSSNQLDRLRLLGNGVVPQTACKAYKVLKERFNEAK